MYIYRIQAYIREPSLEAIHDLLNNTRAQCFCVLFQLGPFCSDICDKLVHIAKWMGNQLQIKRCE